MKRVVIHKYNLLVFLFFIGVTLSVLSTSGQKNQHEYSISCGGGVSAFFYQPHVKNSNSIGFYGDAAVGFTGFFSPQWGIHTGLGLGLNNVSVKVKELNTITPKQIDRNNFPFDLYTTLHDYQENHQIISLYIPLMLQFQTAQEQNRNWTKGKKAGYYVMGGVKALLLVSNKHEAKVKSLYNAAYYPEFDNWAATQIFAGLSKFDGNNTDGNLKLNAMISFAFETGLKWRIGKNTFLYSGVFFDCGLNDPFKNNRQPFSLYIYAEKLEHFTLLSISKRMHLINTGIKLRLAFIKATPEFACPYQGRVRNK